MVLAGALRVPANATTPPPMVRLTEMVVGNHEDSSADDQQHDAADAIESTSYTVATGDSLWRIAKAILEARGMPSSGSDVSEYWRSIYEANRHLIGNDPNLIHPDQVFVIPEG
jgi:nucleoid-associated protein YgaU